MKKENLSVSEQRILLFSVLVLSTCGIIYELVLGSLATYLLGNPVLQYSITIGFFLSSMGLGSYLSRFITKNVLRNFIIIEILLGVFGGVSIVILTFAYSFGLSYYLLHILFLMIIGSLVGLEIPLLTRILKGHGSLKEILSNVLTFDYIGGLIGSLVFPLILYPMVGRLMSSFLVGSINIAVALIIMVKIDYTSKKKSDFLFPLVSLFVLIFLTFSSSAVNNMIQKRLFQDDIILTKKSRYQEIVLTRDAADFRLYLNGSIQFSTSDEYRYHEMLIFPALKLNKSNSKRVLVLGGGDGLAVRSILTNSTVKSVVLVELDQAMIDLAKNNSTLKMINKDALRDKKVEVVVGDAYNYLLENRKKFDVIIADFPDPHDETIAKLYTQTFFRLVKRSLHDEGVFVSQSTSPLFATDAFWCINRTMDSVFEFVVPYHVFIPSFGDWGFNIAMNRRTNLCKSMDDIGDFRFFSKTTFCSSLNFPNDSKKVKGDLNTFNRPILYNYYRKGWNKFEY